MITPAECFLAGLAGTAVLAKAAPGMFFLRGKTAPAVVSVALAWFLFVSHFSETVKLDVGTFLAPYLLFQALEQVLGGRR